MSPLLMGGLVGALFGAGLLVVVRRLPFLRRPTADERISPYLRDLGRLLRSLSTFLRDDARTRSELESRQSWSVNGARVAVAAPWLVLALLSFQGDVIQRYNSPVGALIIGAGAVVCVIAYRLMLRIGRLPEPERVLR